MMTHQIASTDLSSKSLLDKIDGLFALGIGDYIDLPQLVVVGDQSSGKSSVLEGISRIPFPRDSELCTRFATQIIFRRAEKVQNIVSIIPAPDADEQHSLKVGKWEKEIESFDSSVFASLLNQARELMGISSSDSKTFSKDVLKFELTGPDREHLSFVDIPGIFRKKTAGVTTENDKRMVKEMVSNYIKNQRSVILAVIPANIDIATQEILDMTHEADPDGFRTVGVLTKPDLVDPGAESSLLDLVKSNRGHPLRHGWHVVRNPGQSALGQGNEERSAAERDFFKYKTPWSSIESAKHGIPSLKAKLKKIIDDHTRQEFPKVRKELMARLNERQRSLKEIGPERSCEQEHRIFLLDISSKYQELARRTLKNDHILGTQSQHTHNLNMITRLVHRNEKFYNDIRRYGHWYTFLKDSEIGKGDYRILDGFEDDFPSLQTTTKGKSSKNHQSSMSDHMKSDRKVDKFLKCFEVEDEILDELDFGSMLEETVDEPRSGILAWLQKLYNETKGFEIATFDPALLWAAMQQQASKWAPIALGYIRDAIGIVNNTADSLFVELVQDSSVRDALRREMHENMLAMYQRAISHVQFLVDVELQQTPMTQSSLFRTNLYQREFLRYQKTQGASTSAEISTETLQDAFEKVCMSNSDAVALRLHDSLASYYELTLNSFVDAITKQASGMYLLSGEKTPLKFFSPELISKLSPETLNNIAGEDSSTSQLRQSLKKEILELETGRKLLSK